MYRCISQLRGLVIDVNTFDEISVDEWKQITERYKCLFLTTDEEQNEKYKSVYGDAAVYKLATFVKLFAPNQSTHANVLKLLRLKATEVAYVSKSRTFLDHAMCFLGGTIWVTSEITYQDAGKAPDLICKDFYIFRQLVLNDIKGFLGEVAVYPDDDSRGMIIPLVLEVKDEEYPMYTLGRYFGYSHYMSQLHPYSSALYLNKHEGGKAFGVFNGVFANLYVCAVKRIQALDTVDGIVAVPIRPGKIERFEPILESVSTKCEIVNLNDNFKCIRNYPTQKSLSSIERQENVAGAFRYNGRLDGKHIILIDDIITTGATVSECVSALKRCGVKRVSIVVLAINQIQGNYWSSDVAQVNCSKCGEKMHLLINSKNKEFFYSCYGCHNTKKFETGEKELYNWVNKEM